MAEYAEYMGRDIVAQGEYYARHVSAMTAEGLHHKSHIAAELAHRDIVIAKLKTQLAEAQKDTKRLDWFDFNMQDGWERVEVYVDAYGVNIEYWGKESNNGHGTLRQAIDSAMGGNDA